MVSYADRELPNDIAAHFEGSAELAGVDFRSCLDTALVLSMEFFGTDEDVKQRLDQFAVGLEKNRPDVLIIDCSTPLTFRGLNPGNVSKLKDQLGFRLICVNRDSHRENVALINAWLQVCDTMVVFEPLFPILNPAYTTHSGKIVVMPVPAMHGPFLDRDGIREGMLFVGSVYWQPRCALLSVLSTETIPFTAITGTRRLRMASDTTSYARLLRRARAILSVSRHGPGTHLVTGRVWELPPLLALGQYRRHRSHR